MLAVTLLQTNFHSSYYPWSCCRIPLTFVSWYRIHCPLNGNREDAECTDLWVDAECTDLPVEAECADLWVDAECTDLWVDAECTDLWVDAECTDLWVDAECADLPVEAECTDLWVDAECTDLWVDAECADLPVDAERTDLWVDAECTDLWVDAECTDLPVEAECTDLWVDAECAHLPVEAECTDLWVDAECADLPVDAECADLPVEAECTDLWVDAECTDLWAEAECADLPVDAECTDLWVCLVPAVCAPCSATCRGGVGRRSGCWPFPCTWWCSWRSSAWCSMPAWMTGSGNRPWKPHTTHLGREKKASAVVFTTSTKVFIISLNLCYFHIPKIMKNVLRMTIFLTFAQRLNSARFRQNTYNLHLDCKHYINVTLRTGWSQRNGPYGQRSIAQALKILLWWKHPTSGILPQIHAWLVLIFNHTDSQAQRQFCHRYMPD